MASTDKSLGGREYLVGKLKERGFSRRHSVLIVDVILDRMIYALKRGWEVEFPFGKLSGWKGISASGGTPSMTGRRTGSHAQWNGS